MTRSMQDLQGRRRPLKGGFAGLHDTERLADLGKGVCGFQQLLSLVGRAHNRAQPRFTFRDDRVTHCGREDSRLKELLRKFKRFRGLADMNRDNWRLAGFELESTLL